MLLEGRLGRYKAERILNLGTNENDLILDNCMGVGTTGVVCKQLSRNFYGIEMKRKYITITKKRIKKTLKPLFS